MNNYCMIQNSKTFAFSAENPTGVRAGGSQGGDCTKLRPTVTIPAGETVTLVDAAGPGVIQHMWFTGYVGHHFIIRMYWDDQEYPSVEAPLSAFFGCAYDENFVDRDGKYPVLNSAMMLVAPGRGYNSYFEMPFHKRARITMENRGDKDENLYYIITGAYQEIPAEAGYFHATYRQEHPVHKYDVFRLLQIVTAGTKVESEGLVTESIHRYIEEISVLDELEVRLLQMGMPFDRDRGVELLKEIYL